MIISVTKKDIECGIGGASSCPIANAISRRVTGRVLVGYGGVKLHDRFTPVPLPQKAKDFIGTWDSGASVTPIRFTLDI